MRPQPAELRARSRRWPPEYAGRGIELKETASGFRIQVRRELAAEISRLWPERAARYSRALLETLALIAYRQPITRAEIEAVRGVAVNPNIIKTVIERNWVRVVGHRDVPGHPELLGTTREFLDYFGLKSLDELPPLAELKAMGDVNLQLGLAPEAEAAERDAALPESTQRRSVTGGGAPMTMELSAAGSPPQSWWPRPPTGTADGQESAAAGGQAPPCHWRTPSASALQRNPSALQKVLARAGLASRREAEDMDPRRPADRQRHAGRPGRRISPQDQVRLDGRLVHPARPSRARTSSSAPLPRRAADATSAGDADARGASGADRAAAAAPGRRFIAVSPMPRIDGGLELVTSDGELGLRLQRSVHALSSVFGVRVLGELTEAQLASDSRRQARWGRAGSPSSAVRPPGARAANRWYTLVARGASGKEVRQLFERSGATWSGRVLRT